MACAYIKASVDPAHYLVRVFNNPKPKQPFAPSKLMGELFRKSGC
jgi:hypothetical protein